MILLTAMLVVLPQTAPPAAGPTPVVMPESLGYVVIKDPALDPADPKASAYVASGDEYASTPLAEKYGPISKYEADVTLEGVLNSLNRLQDLLAESEAFAKDNGARLRSSLSKEMDAYREQIGARLGKVPWVGSPFQSVPRLPPMNVPSDDQQLISEIIYFEGRLTQVVFRRLKSTTDSGGARTYEVAYFATPDQAVEFRAVVDRLNVIAAKLMKNELEDEVVTLASINRGWKNYLENGFSQYPWESYFNGYVTPRLLTESSWYDPPENQIVLLHPEVGVLADVRTRDSASAKMALLIHGIGYIHYFGEENDWYLGGSATISLSDSDFGLGIGPTVHFGSSARHSMMPNFSVGLLWHDVDDTGNHPVLSLSLDLSRLLDRDGAERTFRDGLMQRAR